MKKTILFCLVLAALLCGCQNRQELESSSQPESSASQEQQEHTAMEQAVDQNLESVLASGVDQDLLEQLGVTLQSGQATLESGSLFTHEVALTSKAGSLQLELEGLYLPDDSHVWEEVGTNMRVCALGIGAAGEDKLLAVTPWQVMILDPAAEDFAPVMLYETEVGGDTEILDAAPAENGGYGLLLWQEDRNLFLLVDDGGRELGRSEFPAGEHGTTFDRDERLISSNPCVFRPVGEAMVNLPGQTDTWLLENRLMLSTATGETAAYTPLLAADTENGTLRLYELYDPTGNTTIGNSGIAVLDGPGGRRALRFAAEHLSLEFQEACYRSEWEESGIQFSCPDENRVFLEAPALKLDLRLDFAAGTGEVEYQYTTGDLAEGQLVAQSPSGQKALYLMGLTGAGDVMGGNYALYDAQAGTVRFLAKYLSGGPEPVFLGEDVVLIGAGYQPVAYDANTLERMEGAFAIPDAADGKGRWALKLLADRQNQRLVALCRPEGYDVGGGEGLSYLVPLSVAVFDQSGALVRQIDTGCRVSESVKNYAYVPDARLENGQLLVEVQNLEADGSVTSQWAAIDYLEGESVS